VGDVVRGALRSRVILVGVCAVLVLVASPAGAAITVDAVASASAAGSSTLSWSHTVGSGSNRLLVVEVAVNVGNPLPVTSVTYGGQPLTAQVQNDGGNPIVEIWTLVSPPTGPGTILVTYPVMADLVGGSVSFAGVDQATPVRASSQNRASNEPPVNVSVSVTTLVGDVVIDAFAVQGAAPTGMPAAGQTTQWTLVQGSLFGGGSTKPGAAGSTTMSWTGDTDGGNASGALAAISLIPFQGVAPTLAKAFGAPTIPLGGTTSLTFTVTNPNTTGALTGVGFTDPLPPGLTVPDGVSVVCGGTLTVSANTVTLAGATIAAGGNCVFSVTVTGTTLGMKNNTAGPVTSVEGGTGNTAPANVTVVTPIPMLDTPLLVVLVIVLAVTGAVIMRRRRGLA
jgi:uncharacterized repeat protein (TIGR01451 family)